MIMESLVKAIDGGDETTFLSLLAEDCEFVGPGAEFRGRDKIWAYLKPFVDAFPDCHREIISSVTTPSSEAIELRTTGTNTGPLQTEQGPIPPTGRATSVQSCDLVRLDGEGRVSSYHVYFDQMGFLSQLGLLPG